MEVIWPPDGEPIWAPLNHVDRGQFVRFCRQFVMELGCPAMSGTLAEPGSLELLLLHLLRDEVGVERHPNNRPATDVAGRLLELTASARGRKDRTFSFAKIAREIELRVDRGRVAQAFPLDRSRYVRPDALRRQLDQALGSHARVLLVGPPGTGKSWTLEALARDLRGEQVPVARHYCFLEPGDPQVQARVALESMSANLVSELLEQPGLAEVAPGVGGDLQDLERALARVNVQVDGSERERDDRQEDGLVSQRVVLIVDGLDHVARVEPEPGHLASSPDDFATALAQLELPTGVQLVVGSQPGGHLDPLRGEETAEVEVPPFTEELTQAQLERIGVLSELDSHQLADEREELVTAVVEQSQGNPLYVRFLAREVTRALSHGRAIRPTQLVRDIPGPNGDLESYYAYLLEPTEDELPAVLVEHLAVADFALSLSELDTVLPAFGRDRMAAALDRLTPVLSNVAGHGGYRIYHESLRRFVVARLEAESRELRTVLDPIISWLESRGFFADARAYRHLLPCLRRAGRDAELLGRMGPDFIARSLTHLQPSSAATANIRLAAHVAADAGDLATLALLAELRRAAATSYGEKLFDLGTYGEAYVELFGADQMADRLMYEGRPVYDPESGLVLCELIDRGGSVAPWAPYLRLPMPKDETNPPEQRIRLALLRLRGEWRIIGPDRAFQQALTWLRQGRPVSPEYLHGLGQLMVELFGIDWLLELLDAKEIEQQPETLPRLTLAAVRGLMDAERGAEAAELAQALDPATLELTELLLLLRCGLSAGDLREHLPTQSILADAVLADAWHAEAAAVRQLRAALPVLDAADEDLYELRERFEGEGWYRAWLRYLVDATRATDSAQLLAALEEAAADTDPFKGKPRASDLYEIRYETRDSFGETLDRLDDDDMAPALELLLKISRGTTTYLQRSASGPLTIWALLDIVTPRAKRVSVERIWAEVEENWTTEYYESHAEAFLMLSRLKGALGDRAAAKEAWHKAAHYLAGYGQRKDITLHGVIEALVAQPHSNSQSVFERLQRIRRLPDYAVYHTDGKETNRLPGMWFKALAKTSAGSAARTLARAMRRDAPVPNASEDESLRAAIAAGHGLIPPLLAHLLWRTVPARYGVSGQLRSVRGLLNEDEVRGREAFLEAAAAGDGDQEHPADEVTAELQEFAQAYDLPEPGVGRLRETRPARDDAHALGDAAGSPNAGPFLAEVDSLPALLRWASHFWLDRSQGVIDQAALAKELHNKLHQLGATEEDILAVAEALARAQLAVQRADVLARIASFYEQEQVELAAELVMLAWCASSGRGWERFGGLAHRDLLERAAELNVRRARRRLAIEAAAVVDSDAYSLGLSRRIGEALIAFGESVEALEVWDRAVEAVEFRLPATGGERERWPAPGEMLDDEQSVRAYAELLAGCLHHAHLDRRGAALGGLAELADAEPELATMAFEFLFEADFTFVDLLIALRLIQALVPEHHGIGRALVPLIEMSVAGMGFGTRAAARQLLTELRLDPRTVTDPVPDTSKVDWHRIDDTLREDPGGRVTMLSEDWRGLKRRVAERYCFIWDQSRVHKDIDQAQAGVQFSAGGSSVPPSLMHRWRREIFECALHDVLPEWRQRVAVRGGWRAEHEAELADMIGPQAETSAALARSRMVRPDLPLPNDTEPGDIDLPIVDRGAFEGWSIASYHETQLIPAETTPETEHMCAIAGAWCGEFDARDDELPMMSPPPTFRWHRQPRAVAAISHLEGRLTTWWVEHDACAWIRAVTLRDDVREALGLGAAPLPAALNLVDAQGEPHAVWRRWWIRPYNYEFHPDTPLFSGGALLLSPRATTTLAEICSGTPRLRVEIDRKTLHPPAGE